MDLLGKYEELIHGYKPREIKVMYDGRYPNTCSGILIIVVNGITIYKKQYCCHSTGSISFDDDWNENVEEGELLWNEGEAAQFPEDIRNAVREKLSEFDVCCGGCV